MKEQQEQPVTTQNNKKESEVLKHNFYVMEETGVGNFQVWSKDQYNGYISRAIKFGAGSAFKIVMGFNGDENYLFPATSIEGEIKSKEVDMGVEKAEEYAAIRYPFVALDEKSLVADNAIIEACRNAFIAGAKWAGNDAVEFAGNRSINYEVYLWDKGWVCCDELTYKQAIHAERRKIIYETEVK